MMADEPVRRLEGGLRTRGEARSQQPFLTVVTVVLNGRELLENTIRSVIGQTCNNIEYILIDGGSTDGTLEIIKKYEEHIDYWLSEPDRGIYDAMNKGTGLATGQWINFMNAGDRFHDPDLVSRVFARDLGRYDLVYGNHEVRYGERFTRIHTAGCAEELWKGMAFSHQSAFVKTSLVHARGFNATNAVSADFELIYGLQRDGRDFFRCDETVATIQAGGVSDSERVKAIRGHWQVVSARGSSLRVTAYYCSRIIVSVAGAALKKLLPQGVIDAIVRLK